MWTVLAVTKFLLSGACSKGFSIWHIPLCLIFRRMNCTERGGGLFYPYPGKLPGGRNTPGYISGSKNGSRDWTKVARIGRISCSHQPSFTTGAPFTGIMTRRADFWTWIPCLLPKQTRGQPYPLQVIRITSLRIPGTSRGR